MNADPNIPLNQMPGSLRSELPRSTAALETSSQDSESNRYTGLQLWMRRLGSASLKRHTRYTDQISLNDGTAIVFSFAIG